MTLQFVTIANSIAALSISGVSVRALTNIAFAVQPRDCPLIQPVPEGFITNFVVERDSFGADAQARKTATYTLNYRFFFAAVGTDRATYMAAYQDFVTAAGTILDTFVANSTLSGLVDLTPPTGFALGVVDDPSGVRFHGCDLPLGIMEYIN